MWANLDENKSEKNMEQKLISPSVNLRVNDTDAEISKVTRQQVRESLSATSANPPSANRIENIEKSTIIGGFDHGVADGGLADVTDSCHSEPNAYTFSDKLNMEDLDCITREIYHLHHGDPAKCDAMILGELNVISGMMGGANMIGDKCSSSACRHVKRGQQSFCSEWHQTEP